MFEDAAKPANTKSWLKSLEKLPKDFHEKQKGEEGLRGEELRMDRKSFTPDDLPS